MQIFSRDQFRQVADAQQLFGIDRLRSETLIHYVLGIENRLRLMGNRTALIPGRMQTAILEHKKLLQAIKAGDSQAAEQLNRERIQHIRADAERSFSFSVL